MYASWGLLCVLINSQYPCSPRWYQTRFACQLLKNWHAVWKLDVSNSELLLDLFLDTLSMLPLHSLFQCWWAGPEPGLPGRRYGQGHLQVSQAYHGQGYLQVDTGRSIVTIHRAGRSIVTIYCAVDIDKNALLWLFLCSTCCFCIVLDSLITKYVEFW